MAPKKLNFRALISLTLMWMFLVLLVSGVVLFVAPPGRFANWNHWAILGLTKGQWQAVHTLTALVFAVGGLLHLLDLNRRAIWSYLRRGRRVASPFFASVAIATLLAVVVVAGTLAEAPPFSLVVALGERATASWEKRSERRAPAPHAEEWSLEEAAAASGMEPAAARSALEAAGLAVKGRGRTLRDIARDNDTSPAAVHRSLTRGAGGASGSPAAAARGHGRKTVAEVAREAGVSLDEALLRLEGRGVRAQGGESLRELAERTGTSPSELWQAVNSPLPGP